MCSTRYYVNLIDDSSHDLIDDSSYAAEKARLQARMAYWTKESAHVKDQNARSNPYLTSRRHGCRGARTPAALANEE